MSSIDSEATLAPSLPASLVRWPGFTGGASAASVTLPHALGLGLLALSPVSSDFPIGAMVMWAVALPCVLMAVLFRHSGVIYAPSTVIALLYGTVLGLVVRQADALGLSPGHALAVTSLVIAFTFMLQWLFGVLRLADLARFMPVPVMQGFAAGVGLAMVLSQLKIAFGADLWVWDLALAWHASVAGAVVLLAWLFQRFVTARWPQFPWLFAATALVALVALALQWTLGDLLPTLARAAEPYSLSFIVIPTWQNLPWLDVVRQLGPTLFSLSALAALVNSLEIVVFRQELAAEQTQPDHGNNVLQTESLAGAACALMGWIPASTSASRSRMASQNGIFATNAGLWHAGLILGITLTGHWWLSWLPMACFAGALITAGLRQIPKEMYLRSIWQRAKDTLLQSWLVALVFAFAGGVIALVTGLVVATVALLKVSASSALRREHLNGQMRSRRLRRKEADQWVAERMHQVAVFELQGIVSFGVAAFVAKQVRARLMSQHRWVILDATRVPAWDETGLAHLRSLARELDSKGIPLALAVTDLERLPPMPGLQLFADVDRALEWAEEGLLAERPSVATNELDPLGELGQSLSDEARTALMNRMRVLELETDQSVFAAGDQSTDLYFVHQGRISMETALTGGLRLATVGRGQAFGEMAFLNGTPRTAHSLTREQAARLLVLAKTDFDTWAMNHPADALAFMSSLAQVSNRRLALTTRQLRAVLE